MNSRRNRASETLNRGLRLCFFMVNLNYPYGFTDSQCPFGMVNPMDRRSALKIVMGLGLAGAQGLAPGHAVAGGKPAADKKKGGGASFIQMSAIAVFVPSGGYRNGTLTLELGLDVPDEKLRTKVSTYIPRLRDAYVTRLQSYAITLAGSRLVDTEYIRNELQVITDTQLKASGAKLLLGSIMVN